MRPHLQEFLERVSKLYEVVVFTASEEEYASKVLDVIDRRGNRIVIEEPTSRIDSSGTTASSMGTRRLGSLRFFIKDIANMRNRNLRDIVAVDDNFTPFSHCLSNLVPILAFNNDREDSELLKLASFLEFIYELEDHVSFLKDYFRLHEVANCRSLEEALRLFAPVPTSTYKPLS